MAAGVRAVDRLRLVRGPLVAHDGIDAFLAGLLIAVIVEGYPRALN